MSNIGVMKNRKKDFSAFESVVLKQIEQVEHFLFGEMLFLCRFFLMFAAFKGMYRIFCSCFVFRSILFSIGAGFNMKTVVYASIDSVQIGFL